MTTSHATMPYGTIPANATQQPESFELHVEEQKLQDFKQLLKLSPVGKDTYENQTRERGFGVTRQWMLDAKKYWLEGFDWRKHEDHINSFPNFKASIKDDDGATYSVHFAALFSKKEDAIPIVFFHGWPGSFMEFLPIMSLLQEKYSPEDLPYHIIVPSLIGYGLSSPAPINRNWNVKDTARIMHKLLLSLGFGDRGYVVQGGDIGSQIARLMAVEYAECNAMHLNFIFMEEKPASVGDPAYTEREQKGLERMDRFNTTGRAYGSMHATRPATIGHVLSSSPLALLAWVGEKFLEWTDHDLPLDTVLADVTLYWFTECFPTSIYPYRQDFEASARDKGYFHGLKELYVDKPVGYSYFPEEIMPIPRAWAEKTGNLVWFKEHERGGHFAALEKPEELWGDVEAFLGVAWKGQ